ncbi:MAG: response regulator, partial [Actinomycetota bacterium]|nr:response regulator [Actinomycetota bacterium]
RIERNIHDGIQQEIVALTARLSLARNQLRRDASLADTTLAQLQAEARQTLDNMRELAHGIHPPVLTDRGLLEAIEARAGRLPLGVTIEADATMRGARFPGAVEGAAYFLVSEAMANTLKHASAARVLVRLRLVEGGLQVEVCDDGVGFDSAAVKGSGLTGLRDRVEATGGILRIASTPGEGTRLTAASRCKPGSEAESELMRVVIAEDHYLVREGTRRLLEDSGEVDVVAAVGSAQELLDAVERLKPDAVIADIRMPPSNHMEGIEAAHAIRADHPEVGVVVLSQHADEAYTFQLFKHGTAGLAYLLKDRVSELDELLRALKETTAGNSVIDPKVVEIIVGRRARIAGGLLASLTPRELEVLSEMAQGKNNAAIALSLVLSQSAIEKHVNSIFSKLGLTEETQLHRRVTAVLTFLRETGAVAPGMTTGSS